MIVITSAASVACGLMAGVFFAFSTFVMKALRSLPPTRGLEAMQAINVTAVGPPLMVALFGTALATAAVGMNALTDLDGSAAWWSLAGTVLYLVGVLVLTAVYHVPRNNAIAAIDPEAPDASDRWARYATGWTAWNHVRTATSLAAASAFAVAASLI